MDQILLSISMLASNRKDTVRRCLNSLKPIMEQIPSELILVDTSTDPEVPPILAEYTDKIIKFQWCNDFSKARNVGLEAAKGEWFQNSDLAGSSVHLSSHIVGRGLAPAAGIQYGIRPTLGKI